ncbi:MAG: tail fiber domain-containing protein [Cognatishimia sp.]|uniref:tail fiber domain-containing protein n=1 Tax=Cognatishimia sp. TaxID=2211648 RepID=UPI00405901A3
MTDIPAKADLSGSSVSEGDFKGAMDQLIDALEERLKDGTTAITNFVSTGMDDQATGAAMALANTSFRLGQSGSAVSIFHLADNAQFVRFFGGNAANAGGGILLYGGAHSAQPDQVRIQTGSTERMRFEQGGTVRPGGDDAQDLASASFRFSDLYLVNSPTVSSGENMKSDIQDLPLGLDFVKLMKPRAYKLKGGASGRTHAGFVAEEVEEAIIAAGLTTQDVAAFIRTPLVDEDGAPILGEDGKQTERLGLRYTELVPVVVRGLQEAAAATEALEARVAALEV